MFSSPTLQRILRKFINVTNRRTNFRKSIRSFELYRHSAIRPRVWYDPNRSPYFSREFFFVACSLVMDIEDGSCEIPSFQLSPMIRTRKPLNC